MDIADDSVHPHEMVHVRMGYEEHVHRFQNPLGQMMNLAAIDKDAASKGTDVEQKDGIVE
jgi:hypothetical protein